MKIFTNRGFACYSLLTHKFCQKHKQNAYLWNGLIFFVNEQIVTGILVQIGIFTSYIDITKKQFGLLYAGLKCDSLTLKVVERFNKNI